MKVGLESQRKMTVNFRTNIRVGIHEMVEISFPLRGEASVAQVVIWSVETVVGPW